MSQTASSFPSKGNPYEALSLKDFATASEIKKQYRQLCLKLHPDRRKQSTLTQSQNDDLDKQFIAVQEARDFLVNDDHKNEKVKYDRKLKGEFLRKEEEKARDAAMSSRRKRMRDDLESKIRNLQKTGDDNHGQSKSKFPEDDLADLERDGKRMREQFHMGREKKMAARDKKDRKNRKAQLEHRQVRVKWSRKKMGSQSDEMIAKLLSRFGSVEAVELIGSKGNAALATFTDASCCKPCVNFYLNNNEIRTSFVGKRKDAEEEQERDSEYSIPKMAHDDHRDRESVEERKLRQAAERELLLRRMELEEDLDEIKLGEGSISDQQEPTIRQQSKSSTFPPSLPSLDSYKEGIVPSCLERLQHFEKSLLSSILSSAEIDEMKFSF